MPTASPDNAGTATALNSGAIHLLRGLRAADRQSGLTPARLSALSVLVFGGPTSLGRLAGVEDVAGPTMTRIVDGLCRLGLARREPHPESGRSVRISATPDGERLMRAAAQRRIDVISRALDALPPKDRQLLHRAAPALAPLAVAVKRVLDS
ncbi:MAG TPA: MarR family winged helix-turn-helix transcriptional regulator [Nocardioidaceae bacterium]|nr:MarR family winged helix-turn-helix transcriptional regulator [Nocardioidaceae bacterium]